MNQYLANLNQTIQNQSLVYNAVSANLSGDFADVPQMPQDMRSVEDKLRDIDTLKTQLRPMLMSLTDGATANEIVKELDDNPKLLQVAIQAFPTLYQSLKPLWSMGVPAVVFIQAVANIQEKIDQTAGIDPAIGATQSGLLDRIPYVGGLETDAINRQIRIDEEAQAEEEAAKEREADRLQGEANLQQAQDELEELQRVNAAISRIRRAKQGVKMRREQLAQLQAQQAQQAQQAPPLGLPSLQVPPQSTAQPTSPRAAEAIARAEARLKQRESQSPVQAQAVQAEPIVISAVALGKATRAIEEGSYEDTLQQLLGNTREKLLTLTALSDSGGDLTIDGNPVSIEELAKTGNGNKYGNPNTQKYWKRTNVEELHNIVQSRKPTSGSGLKSKPRRRTMSGRGVSFNIKEDEEAKPSPKKTIKLNIQGVIEKEPSYVPFGRYAINKHRLAGDILMLRTPKNGVVLKLPTQKISNKLSKIITTVANKGVPSFEAIGELDNNDKEILHKILQECHITNISTPNPSRDKSDDMYRRFVILRGEICSGNNNPSLAKELKRLIIVLMGKDLLPKREGTQALVELALLEM